MEVFSYKIFVNVYKANAWMLKLIENLRKTYADYLIIPFVKLPLRHFIHYSTSPAFPIVAWELTFVTLLKTFMK